MFLKNKKTNDVGIKRTFYTVVKMNDMKYKYYYYINDIFSGNDGDFLIYRNNEKSKIFNCFTLNFLGVCYSFYKNVILFIFALPFVYYTGMVSFIKELFGLSFRNKGQDFFHLCNFTFVITYVIIQLLTFNF